MRGRWATRGARAQGIAAARRGANACAGGRSGDRLLALATVAITVVAGTFAADGTELGYDSYLIDTGDADWRTLLAGRLTGGATEDLAVFTGTGQTRSVAVYSRDGDAFTRVQLAEIPRDIENVDLMRLGSEVALVGTGPRAGGVDRFDPKAGIFKPLESRPSQAGRSDDAGEDEERRGLRRFDFARDLNGYRLDDLFGNGIVRIQRPDGRFGDPILLSTPDVEARVGLSGFGGAGMPATLGDLVSVDNETLGPLYLGAAVHRLDYDGDGVRDLALAVDGGLAVHRGLSTGGWAADPVRMPMEAVSLFRLLGLAQEAGEFVVRPQLLAVEDFNADGIGDVVTVTASADLTSTRYDFHFGRREGAGTVFREASDTSIAVEGTIALSELSDLDGDGDWDFCAVPVEMSARTVLSGLLTKSVRLDMNCYRMADGTYPREPSARWRLRILLGVPSPRTLADLTGDGVLDAVTPAGRTRLDVLPGTGGADLFAAEPIGVDVGLPRGEAPILFRDLNGDGRADLLVVPRDSGKPVWVALSR